MEDRIQKHLTHQPNKNLDLKYLRNKICREHSLRIRKRKSCKKLRSEYDGSTTQTIPNNLCYSKKICKICSKEDFSFIKIIGEGSFGLVYKAKHKAKQKTFAIKQIGGSLSTYQDLLRKIDEVEKLCKFLLNLFSNNNNSPPESNNIVPIYGIWEQNNTVYTVMKYCPSGDLSRFTIQYHQEIKIEPRKKQRRTNRRKRIDNKKATDENTFRNTCTNTNTNIKTKTKTKTEKKTKKEKKTKTEKKTEHQNKGVNKTILSEYQIWKWISDIANGLKLIHGNGYIHLDLKPANLLRCKKNNNILIGDLGLIAPIGGKIISEGDNRYIAPELMGMGVTEEVFAQTSMDVYSFGISIYELAAQITLPNNGSKWDQLRNIKSVDQLSDHILPFNVPRSEQLKLLITKMMLKNPKDRITIDEILQLPQILEITNNQNLTSKKIKNKTKNSSNFVCNVQNFRNKIKNKYKSKKRLNSFDLQKKLFVFDNKENNSKDLLNSLEFFL
ncbi:membrane-associated tyrosine- and threonine-specific cdc2-inhibitory kinase [Anaeramoeba flamelloides]|uniref:Membrane-associated tyrosine- and threonine-specific cdc2-inhibitory kinase n=1 Tax=Anaeramoeba flamelloides TaxID=1746091 RepID=A0AAV8A6B6_9EUKA|nr:membrane-associated tyrosine- and threonine-specific cdc2-inhibitory kinase [Anaeramoeba flamelloides]